MQIPISVNRSKAAGPAAGSRWARPAASVCRERRVGAGSPARCSCPAGAPLPLWARLPPSPPRTACTFRPAPAPAPARGDLSPGMPSSSPCSQQLLSAGSWDALILHRDLPRPHLSYISPAWKKGVSLGRELGVSLAGCVAAEAAVEGTAGLGWVSGAGCPAGCTPHSHTDPRVVILGGKVLLSHSGARLNPPASPAPALVCHTAAMRHRPSGAGTDPGGRRLCWCLVDGSQASKNTARTTAWLEMSHTRTPAPNRQGKPVPGGPGQDW